MLDRYGTDEQKAMIDGSITGKYRITFGLTEPDARLGCDAHGNAGGAGDARQRQGLADQRREDVDDRHARRHALRAVRPHLGQ